MLVALTICDPQRAPLLHFFQEIPQLGNTLASNAIDKNNEGTA
jgi:hypothetical protein